MGSGRTRFIIDGNRKGLKYRNSSAEELEPGTNEDYAWSTNVKLGDDDFTRNEFSHKEQLNDVHRVRTEPSRSRTWSRNYVSHCLHWTIRLIGTIMNLSRLPLAFLVVLCMISLGYQGIVGLLSATVINHKQALAGFLCQIPGPSYLEVCQPTPPVAPKPNPFFEHGLDYGSKLEEMQELGANSVALPYYLSIGEGQVRKMVLALSATSIPSKERLMPLLGEYQRLTSTAIDGFQDWLTRIDQVVDKTILINAWAESQLQTIEDRQASPFVSINNFVRKLFPGPAGILKTEVEVREAFFSLTGKVEEQVTKVLFQAQRQRGTLTELKSVLESIALAALGDYEVLKKDQLGKKSYWKWVLRSHREEMKDFDEKMEMCANFYALTEQAHKVVDTTLLKLQQMKADLIVFRDELQDSSLMLEGEKNVPLQLYIGVLKSGVRSLEQTRKATKVLKARKLMEIENDMQGS